MKNLNKKINMKVIAVMTILGTILTLFMSKVKLKLQEESGANNSTENTGWIIASLIVVGTVIYFINKFFPEMFELLGEKMKEMFNLIKFS